MNEPTRYRIDCAGHIHPDPNGHYVTYESLTAAQQKIAELEADRDRLRERIGEFLTWAEVFDQRVKRLEGRQCEIDQLRSDLAAHMQTINRMGERARVWREHCETCPGFLAQEKSDGT